MLCYALLCLAMPCYDFLRATDGWMRGAKTARDDEKAQADVTSLLHTVSDMDLYLIQHSLCRGPRRGADQANMNLVFYPNRLLAARPCKQVPRIAFNR